MTLPFRVCADRPRAAETQTQTAETPSGRPRQHLATEHTVLHSPQIRRTQRHTAPHKDTAAHTSHTGRNRRGRAPFVHFFERLYRVTSEPVEQLHIWSPHRAICDLSQWVLVNAWNWKSRVSPSRFGAALRVILIEIVTGATIQPFLTPFSERGHSFWRSEGHSHHMRATAGWRCPWSRKVGVMSHESS